MNLFNDMVQSLASFASTAQKVTHKRHDNFHIHRLVDASTFGRDGQVDRTDSTNWNHFITKRVLHVVIRGV